MESATRAERIPLPFLQMSEAMLKLASQVSERTLATAAAAAAAAPVLPLDPEGGAVAEEAAVAEGASQAAASCNAIVPPTAMDTIAREGAPLHAQPPAPQDARKGTPLGPPPVPPPQQQRLTRELLGLLHAQGKKDFAKQRLRHKVRGLIVAPFTM